MTAGERPAIIVAAGAGVGAAHLAEVLLGLEEEGIPYRVEAWPGADAGELAHRAAVASRLGVGVGAAGSVVAVTTEKLPAGRAYITGQLNATRELDRGIGANAARLVKRLPLFELRT